MSRFVYTVREVKGDVRSGVIEAADEQLAIQNLQNSGYLILSIQPESGKTSGIRRTFRGGRVKGRDMGFLAEQLATLLKGGVPLVRSLSLLADQVESRALAGALSSVAKEVASGSALYKALGKHPMVFSNLWVSLTESGELSGRLPDVLRQIGSYIQEREELKSKLATALIYPAILSCVSLGVLTFFIVRIVPTFAEVFQNFNMKLPPLTSFVVNTSTWLKDHFFLAAAMIIGGVVLVRVYSTTEGGRENFSRLELKVPIFGNFIRNIYLERFLTTMTAMVQSGVSMLYGLSVLEGLFEDNVLFQKGLHSARNDIASGKPLSVSFQRTRLFPSLIIEMMLMGEESGKLADILETLAKFYRERVEQFTRRLSAVIDPILVVFVGAVVAVIVMSIFLPIFQLTQIG